MKNKILAVLAQAHLNIDSERTHAGRNGAYPHPMTLEESIQQADGIKHQVWEILEGPIIITDIRTQLALEYMTIALEHHDSIVLLTTHHLRGSALTLVRPIFEVLYKAAWVLTTATDQQVEKIKNGKFDFPNTGTIVADIDKVIPGGFFQQAKKLSWSDQNQFTHSGKLLRIGRFTGNDLQANYPDEMMVIQINVSLMAALIIVVLFMDTHNRPDDAKRIGALMPSLDIGQATSPSGPKE